MHVTLSNSQPMRQATCCKRGVPRAGSQRKHWRNCCFSTKSSAFGVERGALEFPRFVGFGFRCLAGLDFKLISTSLLARRGVMEALARQGFPG